MYRDEAETHVFENVIDEVMGAIPLWAMHRISRILLHIELHFDRSEWNYIEIYRVFENA